MHEFVRARPGALPPGVVSMVGYRLRTAATDGTPPVHRGLPSPWLTLVVSTAGAVPTAVGPDEDPVRYASLVGGLHTRPAYIHQPPEQAGVQLALDPLACRDLLGVRAGELGLVEDADAVLGRVAGWVRERGACGAPSPRSRAAPCSASAPAGWASSRRRTRCSGAWRSGCASGWPRRARGPRRSTSCARRSRATAPAPGATACVPRSRRRGACSCARAAGPGSGTSRAT